ncbi:isopeptide-forming domain-containing fimbrial protein (plasmid) [Lactobacillus sp. ESL0731]|uniref:isopeptide-forming domain-containing fimbrial protein n=1 Tax=unclassified Lactobacillus TaxID=2620435 RepID=UPI0023F99C05|nr:MULTISPECIES: isopeptide-forming domain-containing fimbrial protein [unclassified Lactobacillus]WEV52092.1 isopeptide-forming domain-containing fimbrial protein [Lactobacillus sp. ESL0700]WEV63217.1 isopeptide-forming domain-containing fimbrial protein [Lactobacillus sp. ESL0731]
MKKLTKRQTKKLLATVGASAALAGVGVTAATVYQINQPAPITAKAAEKVKLGTEGTFAKGKDIAFDINYQIPFDKKMDKLEFYDRLEPCFTYSKARVFDENNNDVTDEGTLNFDKTKNQVSWQAKDPTKWFGRKMTLRPEVNLQENANLDKYLDKNTNQYNIPNVGNLVINDKDIPSNTVYVHTPNDKDPTVTKAVQDKDGNWTTEAKYNQGDEVHYKVTFNIPKNGTDISNVDFEDDLEDVLDLESVKVSDDKGNDITKDEGSLTKDDAKESFVWQPTKDYLTKMPDHSYTVDITAKVKPDADLSSYLDKASNEYKIPNTADMKYNNKKIPSNTVKVVTPPPAKNKVVKSVEGLSGSFHEDQDNIEIGKDFTYKIQFTPGLGQNLKDVEFTDDLEDILDLESVKVENADGKDITDSDGTLKTDKDKESFNWQPKDDVVKEMGGKTYTVLVTAKVKADADLQKYIKNNVIQIPNTAHMKANGGDTPSNTPIITPKTEEPTAKKGIVRDPSNWTKFFGNKTETAAGQDTGDKVDQEIDKSQQNARIEAAEKLVKQNPDGSYAKANKNVTDKQFNDALNTLAEPYKSAQKVKVADQGSDVTTTAPTSADDLKSIINSTTVDSNTAARGDAVDYLLTFYIGNSMDMKSLVLSDDLENVLDLKNVVILDSDGKNITNDGALSTSNTDESWTWTAKDPTKYSRKTLYAAVAANIKPGADLSSYTDQEIPNVGHLQINGKDTPTNEVKTKLNGDPESPNNPNNPSDPNNPDTPDKTNPDKKNPLGKDGALNPSNPNNAITGKNGLLPRTGRFMLKYAGWIVAILLVGAGGIITYLYKKNDGFKEKLNKIFKK